MKLAGGKGDVEKCPYLSEEAKRVLGASTRPPIQRVKIGVGERNITIGEEFVFFRHEKTFYHPPGIMFRVSDTWSPDRIKTVTRRVRDEQLVRIGTVLRFDGIAVRSESGDAAAFRRAVAAVEGEADLPEVLIAEDPAVQEAGLAECGNFRPLIHAATRNNYEAMCRLAVKYGCPLCVKGDAFADLAELAGLCSAAGVQRLVLDLSPGTLRDYITASTAVRQAAICRTTPGLGYPVYYDTTLAGIPDACLALGILKFGSVLVTDPLSAASAKAALTLRQNIYTDPQKPIQMNPGLYPVGIPGSDAPVLLTVNFSLTYFTLQGYLEAAKIPCYMLIVDTEGLSVLTAVAAGKLNETLVAESLEKFGVAGLVAHRRLIIPGYAAPLSGRIEETTGWKVLVGPRDAAGIGEFLEKEWRNG
ncbi:MAG: acetyl-CoA decarbonylase/synthase complex subunit gamma [Methanoregulaceae archaeon]|nr:acetyl-CoA decarbonylase/synthase complex subunit gamma [Methanoregulaceae archaeon]